MTARLSALLRLPVLPAALLFRRAPRQKEIVVAGLRFEGQPKGPFRM